MGGGWVQRVGVRAGRPVQAGSGCASSGSSWCAWWLRRRGAWLHGGIANTGACTRAAIAPLAPAGGECLAPRSRSASVQAAPLHTDEAAPLAVDPGLLEGGMLVPAVLEPPAPRDPHIDPWLRLAPRARDDLAPAAPVLAAPVLAAPVLAEPAAGLAAPLARQQLAPCGAGSGRGKGVQLAGRC